MNDPMIQLIILGAIALFMVLRLRSMLGTRTGFEPTAEEAQKKAAPHLKVVSNGPDNDIADFVEIDSPSGKALAAMKAIEPEFSVSEFMGGARQAYEMILMAFEGDDLETLSQFLSKDVFDSFAAAIDERQAKGLSVNAEFVGTREIKLHSAEFDTKSKEAEITLSLLGELTSEISDAKGKVVEGDKQTIKQQKDVWTFAREMGSDDPNWQLVATGG